jgi:uncharacterized protein (DUF924 family)
MRLHEVLFTLSVALASPVAEVRAADRAATQAAEVVAFWREAGPSKWFAKDEAFDTAFRERFLSLHEAAARGELGAWRHSPDGAFALVILLDQFPRNAFRGTARMYATDAMAREIATEAIVAGYDHVPPTNMQKFFYLPFAHSEDLADQDRAVQLTARLGGFDASQAQHHRDIVRRFGRFPHRNLILGREMRIEEQDYLDSGGYRG